MSDKKENIISFVIIILLILIFIATSNPTSYIINEVFNNISSDKDLGLEVSIISPKTRPIDIKVNQIISSSYKLTATPIINSYNFTINTTTGLIVTDKIALLEQNGFPQIYFGTILAINGNVITLDSPVPYNFTISKTQIFKFTDSLNVNGLVTSKVFGLTNFFNDTVHITRFIWHCEDTTVMDDALFCGRTALTRGILLRKKTVNNNYINYWTIKNNGEFSEIAYDTSYNDKAPAGRYGFSSRISYAGTNKHGVIIELLQGESIELLIQDDLTGLTKAVFTVEGHFLKN